MKPEEMLRTLREKLEQSPCGAILIVSETTEGDSSDVAYGSNLSRSTQLAVLRKVMEQLEADESGNAAAEDVDL